MKLIMPLLAPDGALAAVGDVARAAEDAGFDGVSYSELASDPLLQLTVAAGATSRVELLTNIVVAFGRSPMTLATQARAVQEYSRGRLSLGLGSQIKAHIERRYSMPWSAPAARMVEYIAALQAIWSSWQTGDPLDFRGDFYTHTLMTPMFTPVSNYPAPKVLLAAVGERMTAAAGEVADGLLLHPLCSERYLREVTLPILRRARSGSQSPDRDFEIVSSSFVVTGRDDAERAASKTAVRNQLGFYGSTPAYRPVLDLHGWGALADELNRLSKTADPDKWRQLGQLISDEVLDAFAIVGEPHEIGDALARRYGDLVTSYQFDPVGVPDPGLQRLLVTSMRPDHRA